MTSTEERMLEREIEYPADGLTMRSCFYCDPATAGRRPGLLVFPEAFGLGEHAKSRARRLAGLGYAALASDLHGDSAMIEDIGAVMELIGPLRENPQRTRARARAALEALAAQPEVDPSRVAAIGYCFGGTMALELARSGASILGIVGFHSGLATVAPADPGTIRASILVCIGADDPGIDPAQRAAFEDEMRGSGADWQINLLGGVVHSFTNPDAGRLGRPDFARYDARADQRSWQGMRDFLSALFDPPA
jgi:dienelactone hydrolase